MTPEHERHCTTPRNGCGSGCGAAARRQSPAWHPSSSATSTGCSLSSVQRLRVRVAMALASEALPALLRAACRQGGMEPTHSQLAPHPLPTPNPASRLPPLHCSATGCPCAHRHLLCQGLLPAGRLLWHRRRLLPGAAHHRLFLGSCSAQRAGSMARLLCCNVFQERAGAGSQPVPGGRAARLHGQGHGAWGCQGCKP